MSEASLRGERRVQLYVGALAVAAALAVGGAGWLLWRAPPQFDAREAAMLVVLSVSFVLLQRHGVTFYWHGHRMTTQLDEVAVFLGLVLLPPPILVVLIPAAAVVVHFWVGRTATKGVFNVASYALAAALGAAANVAVLDYFAVEPLVAAIAATAAYVLFANLLLAGVFALLEGAGLARVFVERLAGPTAASAIVGSAGGITLVALARIHPLALAAIAPFGYLLWRFGVLSAQADRELSVHRDLGAVTHDLVGCSDVDMAADRVLDTCGRLLNCGRVTLVLSDARSWSRDFEENPADFWVGQTLSGSGGVHLGELRVHPRRGKPSFSELERELLRVISGQVSSALENARALGAMAEARRKMDLYLTTAQDAVLLIGPSGQVDYVNAAGQRLLGLASTSPNVHASDFFDHPVLTRRARVLAPALLETVAHERANPREFVVEAHVAPVADANGDSLLAVVRDVTERKRLEEETARQREILVRQEKLSTLGTLVAGVAHEVNNPLTFMKSNLELARDDAKDVLAKPEAPREAVKLAESTLESFEQALRGIQRIETITSSLKTVARQGKKQSLENLNDVVRDVLAVLKAGTPKSVTVEARLAEDLPRILGNAGQLHQVALNLVKNAVEALAGRDGARVVVESRAQGRDVLLEVTDNGPGIAEDVLERLFQPFQTTKDTGTGLGLSISREIIRAHGGDIHVASIPGARTSFTVSLPIATGVEPSPVSL